MPLSCGMRCCYTRRATDRRLTNPVIPDVNRRMAQPGVIHPQAQWEYDDIKIRGNYSQRAAAAMAWGDAVLASRTGSVAQLLPSDVHPNGSLFKAKSIVKALFRAPTTGVAVVAEYGHGPCVDVFAVDVFGSPWWHGSSPEVRAGGLLPP